MKTSKLLRFCIIIWLICTIWASITIVSTLNIYIIIFYGIVLFRGCRNLLTMKTHIISMKLLPLITFFAIGPIINLIYLASYLYLLNVHWSDQQLHRLTIDNSEIICKIEPVLPLPGHFKKFWKKFYIIKKGTSYTGQDFSGSRIKNTYQLPKMCCPDSVEQNLYEQATKTQRILVHVAKHDGLPLNFHVYEEDTIKIINIFNNITKQACDAEGSKRILSSE